MKLIFEQLLKYFFVSIVAAIIDFSVFIIFYNLLNCGYLSSNTIAFSFGVLTNYLLSIKYVFVGESRRSFGEFAMFTAIGILGYAISQLTLYICIDIINFKYILESIDANLSKYDGAFAKICSIGTTFIWNFSVRKIILFSKVIKHGI